MIDSRVAVTADGGELSQPCTVMLGGKSCARTRVGECEPALAGIWPGTHITSEATDGNDPRWGRSGGQGWGAPRKRDRLCGGLHRGRAGSLLPDRLLHPPQR